MSEEIITGLSKIPQMFVIARDSTFTYKGKPVKIQVVSLGTISNHSQLTLTTLKGSGSLDLIRLTFLR
jgi:hypothetical protein